MFILGYFQTPSQARIILGKLRDLSNIHIIFKKTVINLCRSKFDKTFLPWNAFETTKFLKIPWTSRAKLKLCCAAWHNILKYAVLSAGLSLFQVRGTKLFDIWIGQICLLWSLSFSDVRQKLFANCQNPTQLNSKQL